MPYPYILRFNNLSRKTNGGRIVGMVGGWSFIPKIKRFNYQFT
jgi:hypothetical protein